MTTPVCLLKYCRVKTNDGRLFCCDFCIELHCLNPALQIYETDFPVREIRVRIVGHVADPEVVQLAKLQADHYEQCLKVGIESLVFALGNSEQNVTDKVNRKVTNQQINNFTRNAKLKGRR